MTATYHRNKMVLRESVDRGDSDTRLILLEPYDGSPRTSVERIARVSPWQVIESNDGAEDAAYQCYRLWGAAAGLWVMYLEDLTTRASALEVFGEDADDVAELSRRILAVIGVAPYTREELLTAVSRLRGQEKIRAMLRVALAMGKDFDSEYFAALADAARDEDPEIRNAAAWSTVYLESPESLGLLKDLAANDPHEAVRNSARGLLADFGIG
ncbi:MULTISPECIES: HEAT repeat domain-containing protein [unclassified Kribbella]|uniref:HEAT repeat domain-containing protein n=1 Tax=unclassified Kribbella TaxID=2644121 RepID=UPI003015AE51